MPETVNTYFGFAVGCVVFLGLFAISANAPDRLIIVPLSAMGAIPVAVIGSIFGAVGIIRDELDKMRQEVKRLQRREEENTIHDVPSTQFSSGPTRE